MLLHRSRAVQAHGQRRAQHNHLLHVGWERDQNNSQGEGGLDD